MRLVSLLGMGCGDLGTVTLQARQRLEQAQLLIGAGRLLKSLPDGAAERVDAVRSADIIHVILSSAAERICVLFSGDIGFYSGAKTLIPLLEREKVDYEVLPGISSLQYLAAKLGTSWQNWRLCSAHGVDCDPVAELCQGKPVFFLTGGNLGPSELCRQIAEAGLGELKVAVGEELSYPTQRIFSGTAAECACQEFAPLSVLLVEPPQIRLSRTPGIPDEEFQRGKVPMTKQEVRCAILAKLGVTPEDVCWDVGAGTGSVSVELALQGKSAWAVEEKPEACALIRANRQKFGAWNLRLTEGSAVEVLPDFPAPDKVFVGGSHGDLDEIIDLSLKANPAARICVSAITLENLSTAMASLQARGCEVEVAQISVSRTKAAANLHLLLAQNPVFLITGARPCAD